MPATPKPEPGPVLDAWLEHRMLYQHRALLRDVLDQIDARIALNQCVPDLDEESVASAILDFLQPANEEGASVPVVRMPMHKARIFLEYFSRRFRQYTTHHHLREVRIPLIREFALDTGVLEGRFFDHIRAYKAYSKALRIAIDQKIIGISSSTPPPIEDCAALIAGSAALFGALPFEAQWQAIVAHCTKPLMSDGQIIWFDLEEPHVCRWIADPVTEGVLRRLTKSGFLPFKDTVPSVDALRKAMKSLLSLPGPLSAIERDLRNAIVGMQGRYFAPDVAAISQGILPNTPLASEPWLRWLTATRHAVPRERISLRVSRVYRAPQVSTVLELETATVIQRIRDAVKSDPREQRRQGDRRDGSEGRLNYHDRALRNLNEQESALIDIFRVAGLLGCERQTYAYGLLCFARDLILLGGAKRAKLADGTIANYVALASNHLTKLHFSNLLQLETDKRQEIYSEAIRAHGLAKGRTDVRTALEGFERSILRNMDIEDEVDWSLVPGRSREMHLPKSDANLIDMALYRCVFGVLHSRSQMSVFFEMALVLLVVLYRFGLRVGEAVELKVADIYLHSDQAISIKVTRSDLTSRKSFNALRVVGPERLPKDEVTFLRNYVEDRREEKLGRDREKILAYLFSTSGTSQLEHVEQAKKLLIDLVRDVSGDPNLRIRHFRHSFISGMFIDGRNPFEKVEQKKPASEWRRVLASGHASPDTSIISYTHLVEVAHYNDTIRLFVQEVPFDFMSRLAGNASRSLERRLVGEGRRTTEQIAVRYLASLRSNYECSDVLQHFAGRTPYPRLVPQDNVLDPVSLLGMDWQLAWQIYAAARVGKCFGDGDQARVLQRRVRALEKKGEVQRRSRRRPQINTKCMMALSRLWEELKSDTATRQALRELPSHIDNARSRMRLPAQIATMLEVKLRDAGVDGVASSPSSSRHRWLYVQDGNDGFETGWMEMLLFLCVCLTDAGEE